MAYLRTSSLGVGPWDDGPGDSPALGGTSLCIPAYYRKGRGKVIQAGQSGEAIIRYPAGAERYAHLRSMTIVRHEKEYPADGPPIHYLIVSDPACVEEIAIPVDMAVTARVIAQAEADLVASATAKTPEQQVELRERAVRQKTLTAGAQARADRDAARIRANEAQQGCVRDVTAWVPAWLAARWCAPGGGVNVAIGAVVAVGGAYLVLRWAGGAAGEAGRRVASAREKKA